MTNDLRRGRVAPGRGLIAPTLPTPGQVAAVEAEPGAVGLLRG